MKNEIRRCHCRAVAVGQQSKRNFAAQKHSYWSGARETSPRLCEWDVSNRGDRSPVEIGTILSACSIARSCSSGIARATFVAIRAAPRLLALGPALHPIGEGSIAVILGSSNFFIMPASLAMLLTAPLLLLGCPPRLPIERAISAIE